MKLKELYNGINPILSFEVFPPKGEGNEYNEKLATLFEELNILCGYNPSLISVTYGAGGSSREKTFELVMKIKEKFAVSTMPHFTCVSFNKEQTLKYIKTFEENGIENVLALRGDVPAGVEHFVKPLNGFEHANELVGFLKSHTDLSLAVAGYPEKHPEAADFYTDILNLKKKVNAGADVIYTQLFFDNKDFFTYCDNLKKEKINIPVIPGIMVLQSVSQIERIIKLSGSKVPENLLLQIEKYADNPVALKQTGIEYATKQVSELLSAGVKGLHFYPLNKSFAVSQVLENIKSSLK